MDGTALDVALALWRVPSLRGALRQRPLPDDVGDLIEIAAGTPNRVAMAAASVGEPQDQVLEAARFYVREVLLCAEADAYRVLGVSPEASSEQIKAHHRALQHWLHPDRRGDDWESVFASRINTAWGELRSAERRVAYDARNALPTFSAEVEYRHPPMRVTEWQGVPAKRKNVPGWLALGAAVGGCIWLAVLADRQASAPLPEWNVTSKEGGDGEVDSLPPTLAALAESVAAKTSLPRNAAGVTLSQKGNSPKPVAFPTEPVVGIAKITSPTNGVATTAAPRVQAARILLIPSEKAAASATLASPIQLIDVGATEAGPVPMKSAVQARSVRKKAVSPLVAVPAEGAPARPAQRERSQIARLNDLETFERVRLAHRRGQELTRYLSSTSGRAPPIWQNVAAQDAAASIRGRLDDFRPRITRVISPLRFGDSTWRIGAERALMISSVESQSSGAETATLRVEFKWRNGMWLVDSVEAEDLP